MTIKIIANITKTCSIFRFSIDGSEVEDGVGVGVDVGEAGVEAGVDVGVEAGVGVRFDSLTITNESEVA